MSSIFEDVKINVPNRNSFNLSHNRLQTLKFGELTPFLCQEVVPGDTFKCETNSLIRFAPMLAPIMQNIDVYTHFFFVPYRLVFDKWRDFITNGKDGKTQIPFPTINDIPYKVMGRGSLADFLGFPPPNRGSNSNTDNSRTYLPVSALPFRAYQLIYNEYYRDQNVDEEIPINMGAGAERYDSNNNFRLFEKRTRCWRRDYFTSALPFAQRGEEITLPMHGSLAPLSLNDANDTPGVDAPSIDPTNFNYALSDGLQMLVKGADLSNVSAATINELRRAIKAQEFLEARARGGSRYIEQIKTIFGVQSSDARLQRPEFLGGGKSPVVISDVLQTSASTDSSPQAQPAGHGVGVHESSEFEKYFEEHGMIIGIMSVVPKAMYYGGMPRQFMRRDTLDFYWPQFSHLGEQEILKGELFYDYGNMSLDNAHPRASLKKNDELFGYIPRYAEYKFICDSIHGDFTGNMSFWHMGRTFDNYPGLNSEFLHILPNNRNINNVFAVTDDGVDKIWVQIRNTITAVRPMPHYGTPKLF